MKKLMIGAVCAMMAAATFAEPKVEITEAYQQTPGSGVVNYTYTISGLKGVTDLYIKVGAEGCAKTVVLTNLNVKAGTVTAEVDVKTLLGQAYPNVTLFAELEDGVQLWENGPYFAKANIGATKPEEYGWYFWWGDTVGYKRNGSGFVSVKDGTAFAFTKENCSTHGKNEATLKSNGWINYHSGNLDPFHDAATAKLGAPWRMPTDAELVALGSNCTTVWKTNWNGTGVNGFLVTGKGAYASKSIFLPAEASTGNSAGSYWSATPYNVDPYSLARHLQFDGNPTFAVYANGRWGERVIRAVR